MGSHWSDHFISNSLFNVHTSEAGNSTVISFIDEEMTAQKDKLTCPEMYSEEVALLETNPSSVLLESLRLTACLRAAVGSWRESLVTDGHCSCAVSYTGPETRSNCGTFSSIFPGAYHYFSVHGGWVTPIPSTEQKMNWKTLKEEKITNSTKQKYKHFIRSIDR